MAKHYRIGSVAPILASFLSVPALADPITISGAQTTPVATATASNGTPGDVTIASGGSVSPTTSGAAVTINSSNNVSNAGSISFSNVDNAIGIQAYNGVTGTISNSGTITVSETYTQTDTNGDGVLDGVFAQGTGRFGIQTLGAFNGSIGNSGTITVHGTQSAGIALGGTLGGSLTQSGSITVVGDNSYGINAGNVTGNIALSGSTSATGANAIAAYLGGDVGGALTIQGSLNSTGYSSVTQPASVTGLTAQNLLQNGPALWIAGNIAGGANLGAASTVTNSDGTTTSIAAAVLTSYGAAPALQIGAASRSVALGAVSGDANGSGLVVAGTLTGSGVYTGVASTGLQIGGLGGPVTTANGVTISGAITATTNAGISTALHIGSGASVPSMLVSGTVGATETVGGGLSATGILIDSGANVASITNSGTISAIAVSGSTATAIIDHAGTLASITNSGTISASTGTTNVAIDLSARTSGATVIQQAPATGTITPSITGDIAFGSGNDQLAVSVGAVKGNVSFGGGADQFLLSGSSTYVGNADFAGGAGLVSIGGTSTFTGQLTNAAATALAINGGTFTLTATQPTIIGSLAMTGGTLAMSISAANASSLLLQVQGNASFTSGSALTLRFTNLNYVVGDYHVIQAGSLTGASNLTVATTTLPFLYGASLNVNAATSAIDLIVARKTAAQLGLSPVLSVIYEPAYAAALGDSPIGDNLLGVSSLAALQQTLEQQLPNFEGDLFDAVSLSTRGVGRLIRQPELPSLGTGKFGGWIDQVAWTDSKSTGSTIAYRTSGWGIVGGVERSFGVFGRLGVSLGYIFGTDNSRDTGGNTQFGDLEPGVYWRQNWGRLHAYARGAMGFENFTSKNFFAGSDNGTAFTRTAAGKWSGQSYTGDAGLSYRLPVGRWYVQPQGAIDYVRLHEDGYAQSGGGSGFDLIVDPRTSTESAANGSVVVGYNLMRPQEDKNSFLRVELEGGERSLLSSKLATTTAHYDGGSDFALNPEARKSGWTAATRVKGGSSWLLVTGEVDAEKEQDHVGFAARAGIQLAL